MNNSKGIKFLFKNRKIYIISLLVGGVLGGILTFFIPKKYMSTAIVYPYNSHTVSSIVSNPQFGYEVETEQLLQLFESRTMRDKTIEKFNLQEYYEEDTLKIDWKSKLSMKYIDDVTFFRSKYLSVVINVTTKDPELSADIANFQVEEVNRYREAIFEENRRSGFLNFKEKYLTSEIKLNELTDSIYLVKGGDDQLLYNFVQNLDNENYNSSEFIDDPKLESLIDRYLYEKKRFEYLRTEYDKQKQILEEELPSIYSVDVAQPNYKKKSPSFSINIVLGAVTLFILSLTLTLIFTKWRELKDNQ